MSPVLLLPRGSTSRIKKSIPSRVCGPITHVLGPTEPAFGDYPGRSSSRGSARDTWTVPPRRRNPADVFRIVCLSPPPRDRCRYTLARAPCLLPPVPARLSIRGMALSSPTIIPLCPHDAARPTPRAARARVTTARVVAQR